MQELYIDIEYDIFVSPDHIVQVFQRVNIYIFFPHVNKLTRLNKRSISISSNRFPIKLNSLRPSRHLFFNTFIMLCRSSQSRRKMRDNRSAW